MSRRTEIGYEARRTGASGQRTAKLLRSRVNGAGYAVFGVVLEGMDVVDRISNVSTGQRGPHENVPNTAVLIRGTRIEAVPATEPPPVAAAPKS